MENAIVTRQLTKSFEENTALKNLDLCVPYGSIFAFLGPNGAGKTTMIKTIMNIMSPSQGSAEVLGIDSTRLGPEQFINIGYVSENQELPMWMTVKEFLRYCRSMYPNWDETFCQSLLKQFDLPQNKKIRDLSRGMKMKASLVSSLAYRPKLLIFDEPFSGLDPLVRQEFIDGVLEITETENWTIFISSHDIDEVERLADWVAMIDKGTLMINERTETLQARFRQVQLTLDEPLTSEISFPEEWLSPEQKGRVVRFVDTHYQEGISGQTMRTLFPKCSNINAEGMTLREIFLALAKQFKISKF